MTSTYIEKATVETEIDLQTDRTLKEEWRDEKGLLHRTRGLPAVTKYADVTEREYWFQGDRHRINGPAVEFIWPETDIVFHEIWYSFGNELGCIERDPQTGQVLRSDFEELDEQTPTPSPEDPFPS